MVSSRLRGSILLILIQIFIFGYSVGQQNAILKGKVIDGTTGKALSFATVKVLKDGKMLIGDACNEGGEYVFSLEKGKYVLEIDFVGYLKATSAEIDLNASELTLAPIKIFESDRKLDELVVQGEKSSMELSLDKRVFNVGKDLANAGGTASDILINIPSVTVDPDGAIKLRGSSNVRILIDGKPSGQVTFKGGAGLRQLQASMVERVEVITNPSARYEAEGQAGIINIILKKDSKQGFNGSFELISGIPANFGVGANVNYRHKKVNFFLNYSVAFRRTLSRGDLYQEVYVKDSTKILEQNNNGVLKGFDNNIRGGIDYYFNEKSVLTGSYLYSRAGGNRFNANEYLDYLNSTKNRIGTINREQREIEREPLSEYIINYKKEFARKGHELSTQFRFLDHFENSDQRFTQNATLNNGAVDNKNTLLQTSINDEYEKQYLVQVDYVKPWAKDAKLEVGARTSIRNMVNDYVVNNVIDGKAVPIPQFDNYFVYNENISAAYGIISNKKERFSYQVGLRGEWTDVRTVLEKTNEVNPRKYFNAFPSVHVSYLVQKDDALQISYSRRIRRPVYNDLSPFMTLSDSRNFFSGNPNLNPEYSDVIELGYLRNFEKGSLSSSLYYRNTVDLIFGIRRVNTDGFSTSLPENLKGEQAYGFELISNYNIAKWWKTDFNLNVFHANIDGSNIEADYKTETSSWFFRHTSRFTPAKGLDLQLRANYEAAQKTAQGSRKAIYFFDLSVKKDIWNRKGSLNFSVLDVFNTRWSRTISEGPGFYTYSNRQGRTRQVNLTLSYRLKQ